MSFNLNNKWDLGNVQLVLPELPEEVSCIEGILPWNLALDPKIGTETVLLLFDRTPFIYELKKVNPFILDLKSGLENTSHGPVGYFLFFIPDPNNPDQPFMSIDCYVDPFNPAHLLIWGDLARQTHWHLILVGDGNQVVGFYEFNNLYNLEIRLSEMVSDCRNMDRQSFDMAKLEFQSKYSVDDLFSMGV